MNERDLLAELAKRGLHAWQAGFVASFVGADPTAFQQVVWPGGEDGVGRARASYQLLTAPAGTGRTPTVAATVRELAARGAARILVLSPASLCEVWQAQIALAQPTLPVSVVTRRLYREMEAATPVGQSPWSTRGVFVMGQDFAKRDDIASGLTAVTWDLVIVDEAHRFKAPLRSWLLEGMEAEGVVQRLLLLTALPVSAIHRWLRESKEPLPLWAPPVVTSWHGVLKDWGGSLVAPPKFDLELVPYTRGADEVQFIGQLRHAELVLQQAGSKELWPQELIERAASSAYAAEQGLERRRQALASRLAGTATALETDEEAETDSLDREIEEGISASTPANAAADLRTVEASLAALSPVTTDEKLRTLRALIQSIAASADARKIEICILSQYLDTAAYLKSAIEDLGPTVFKLTGRDSLAERAATLDEYRRTGGILVATDGALSEGLDVGELAHVVNYDLHSRVEALERRWGKVARYGRSSRLKLYAFSDSSGAIPSEVEATDRLKSLRTAIDKPVDSDNPRHEGSTIH